VIGVDALFAHAQLDERLALRGEVLPVSRAAGVSDEGG